MSLLVKFGIEEENLYRQAIRLSGASKLKIKTNTYDKQQKSLHNEGEDWSSVQRFWKVFRELKDNSQYIDFDKLNNEYEELSNQFDVLIGDMTETFYYTKLEIRSLTFEEQMKNAMIREKMVNDLPRDKRKKILLAKLDMLIEDSLDKMNENNFRVYSGRRNRVLRMK